MSDLDVQGLLSEARIGRSKAYAPYSNFHVGAALLLCDGRIIHGCNVENASYGLCNCAERTALFSAISQGYKPADIAAIAVVGNTDGPIAPCGACRQVMIELGTPAMTVILGNMGDALEITTAGALLPGAFYLDPNHS